MSLSAERQDDLRAAVVQVRDGRGRPAGTGFLVADRLVVTCAHVLGGTVDAPPAEPVSVVFTHLDDMVRAARAEPDLWRGPAAGDLAFLHVTGGVPPRARPLPLGAAAGSRRHQVRTYGFPLNAPGPGHYGYAVAGDLIEGEHGAPLLQLTDCTEVTEGFSGGPVLDEQTGLVIGMVDSVAAPDRLGRGRATAYATPAETLRAVCPQLTVSAMCPYRGLEPFTTADARWFHGRTRAVRAVLSSLEREPGFLALLGPSGSGKSSLVQAGVLPALAAGGLPGSDRWAWLTARPGTDPHAQVEAAGLPGAGAGLAAAVRRRLDADPGHDRLVLVLDQFEELLVAPPEERRAGLLTDLVELYEREPAVTVIITMRDDFYSGLAAAAPALMPLVERSLVNVPATLDRDELAAMIEQPARAAGLTLEPELTDRIAEDAGQLARPTGAGSGTAAVTVLPLLESALTELWNRREDGRLTHAAYRRIGQVAGWLGRWCDLAYAEAYRGLTAEQRPLIRQVVTSLVRPGDEERGVPPTRQRRTLEQVRAAGEVEGAGAAAVVAALADRRLITTGRDAGGEPVVELAHEALITEWQLLRRWLAEDAEFLTWRRDAEGDHAQWLASVGTRTPHDPALLLYGSALAAARQWRTRRPAALHPDLLEFIRLSEANEYRRLTRDRRRVVVLSVLSVFALVFGMVAVYLEGVATEQARTAEDRLEVAESRRLATQAVSVAERQPDLAQLLALESLRSSPSDEAWASLGTVLSERVNLSRQLTGHGGSVEAVAFSRDGRTLASADRDGELRLWDATTSRPAGGPFPERRRKGVDLTALQDMALSPDGKTLATIVYTEGVRLWDTATRRPRGGPIAVASGGFLGTVAFSPDGRTLAAASGSRFEFFDVATRNRIGAVVDARSGGITDLAFSPDGRTVAISSESGLVRTWDVATRRRLVNVRIEGGAAAVAFSPDGTRLATGGQDGTGYVLTAAGADTKVRLPHPGRIRALGFRPDGKVIAVSDSEGTVRLWDPANGRQVGIPLTGHQGSVGAVAFSPDGSRLASGGTDETVRSWNLVARQPLGDPLSEPTARVYAVAFGRDGTRLATGGFDRTVRVWDVAARKQVDAAGRGIDRNQILSSDPVTDVAVSPDGRRIASASTEAVRLWELGGGEPVELSGSGSAREVAFSPDGTLVAAPVNKQVRFWTTANGAPAGAPLTSGFPVSGLAFSPDGRRLATGGSFGRGIQLWDVNTREKAGELPGPGGTFMETVVFSPDGRLVAGTGYWAGDVHLWDTTSRKPAGEPLRHAQPVTALAFSPDSRLLATAGDDHAVRLWNVSARKLFAQPLLGHTDRVDDVAFSPDGTMLASASWDGTVRLWAAPRTWVQHACELANRNLSQAEWDRYVGSGKAYVRHCARYPAGLGADPEADTATYENAPDRPVP